MWPFAQPQLAVVTPMLQMQTHRATLRMQLPDGGPTIDHSADAADLVWPTLAPLSAVYPGFKEWFRAKVLHGIADGRRRIFVVGPLAAPSAIAIAKRELAENKLCTLWVSANARGSGIGSDLVEEVVDWLSDRSPLLTVPAERYAEFVPLVRRYGFVETARMPSLYRPGVVEHVFNGTPSSFRSS